MLKVIEYAKSREGWLGSRRIVHNPLNLPQTHR